MWISELNPYLDILVAARKGILEGMDPARAGAVAGPDLPDGLHSQFLYREFQPGPGRVQQVQSADQARDLSEVPRTLRDATERFATSPFIREAFGSEVQDHYGHFFTMEQRAYDNAVTDWERGRYFERI